MYPDQLLQFSFRTLPSAFNDGPARRLLNAECYSIRCGFYVKIRPRLLIITVPIGQARTLPPGWRTVMYPIQLCQFNFWDDTPFNTLSNDSPRGRSLTKGVFRLVAEVMC